MKEKIVHKVCIITPCWNYFICCLQETMAVSNGKIQFCSSQKKIHITTQGVSP